MTIDTTNMCSHLQKKLFEEDGIYHHIWIAMQDDPELTAATSKVWAAVLQGKIIPVYCNEIEYIEVLHRKKFDIPEHLIY